MKAKLTGATSDVESNIVSKIQVKIKELKKEIKDMEQRQGILVWQLKKYMLEEKK